MDVVTTSGIECGPGAGDAEQPGPIDYGDISSDEYSSDEEEPIDDEEEPSDAEERQGFDNLPENFEEGTFILSRKEKAVAFKATLQQTPQKQNVLKGTDARAALGKARALDESIEKILRAREDNPGACLQLYAGAMQNDAIASNPAVTNSLLVAVIAAHERRCAQAVSAVDAEKLRMKRLKELTEAEKLIQKYKEATTPSVRTLKALEKKLVRRQKLQELLGFTTEEREPTPAPTREKRTFVDDDDSADEAGPAQQPKRAHVEE
jgi:hypothetical protein